MYQEFRWPVSAVETPRADCTGRSERVDIEGVAVTGGLADVGGSVAIVIADWLRTGSRM